MNTGKKFPVMPSFSRRSLFGLIALLVPMAHAATVWTGAPISFTQTAGSDPTQSANQDRITPNVWITRAGIQGIYNAKLETAFTHTLSPADTEWANGTTADVSTLSFADWNSWAKGVNPSPPSTVGVPAVVHLISEDIYIDIKFTSWGSSAAGGFAYQRSTPAVVSPAPSVSITNPVGGTVFPASAQIKIQAAADVSGGSVTNVVFLGNGNPFGSAQAVPFSITASNLAVGNYILTAVATAGGISTTSAAVNISVVAPIAVLLSAPQFNNGQFSFDYTVNPGLSYVIQNSSNLVNWVPVVTNVPANSPAHFSESINAQGLRFYRVSLRSNP